MKLLLKTSTFFLGYMYHCSSEDKMNPRKNFVSVVNNVCDEIDRFIIKTRSINVYFFI